jgi:c-di-AMP phosphodiesterase-like protein
MTVGSWPDWCTQKGITLKWFTMGIEMKLKSISLLLINQYSFIAFGLIILVIITVSGWYSIGITYTALVAGLTFALLIASQLLLSTRTRPYSSIEAFDKSRTSGQPVLLILYSDF